MYGRNDTISGFSDPVDATATTASDDFHQSAARSQWTNDPIGRRTRESYVCDSLSTTTPWPPPPVTTSISQQPGVSGLRPHPHSILVDASEIMVGPPAGKGAR